MFKRSHFNIKVVDQAGFAFWFNTATGQRLELSPADLEQVERFLAAPYPLELEGDGVPLHASPATPVSRPQTTEVRDGALPLERPLAHRLLELGFLVPSERQEVREVLDRLRIDRRDPSHLSVTIALTSDCDLACPYCIVPTTRDRGPMSPEVRTALLRWWERQLIGRKSCSIEWMGGEPLLYPQVLLELGEAMLERARFAEVKVTSHGLYTNGTRLTLEVAQRLKALGVKHVQVTLDGPAESHDRCRPSLDGRGTFERIVANLQTAAPLLHLLVRMNVSSRNRDTYQALLDRLAAEGLTGHIQVYAARAFEPELRSACGSFAHCALPPEDFGKLSIDFQLSAMERGFSGDQLPKPARGGYCGAYTHSYFVVDHDGLLYRCPARLGQPQKGAVGSVNDFVRADYMEGNQAWYDRLEPTGRKGCFGCKILPVCLGGCPEESKASGQLRDECSPWKFKIRDQLVIEHEWHKTAKEQP